MPQRIEKSHSTASSKHPGSNKFKGLTKNVEAAATHVLKGRSGPGGQLAAREVSNRHAFGCKRVPEVSALKTSHWSLVCPGCTLFMVSLLPSSQSWHDGAIHKAATSAAASCRAWSARRRACRISQMACGGIICCALRTATMLLFSSGAGFSARSYRIGRLLHLELGDTLEGWDLVKGLRPRRSSYKKRLCQPPRRRRSRQLIVVLLPFSH